MDTWVTHSITGHGSEAVLDDPGLAGQPFAIAFDFLSPLMFSPFLSFYVSHASMSGRPMKKREQHFPQPLYVLHVIMFTFSVFLLFLGVCL